MADGVSFTARALALHLQAVLAGTATEQQREGVRQRVALLPELCRGVAARLGITQHQSAARRRAYREAVLQLRLPLAFAGL
jgi:hypothetical protein